LIPLTLKSHAQVNRLSYFPFLLARCVSSEPSHKDALASRAKILLSTELQARDSLRKRGISDRGADYLVEMCEDYGFINANCLTTADGSLIRRLVGQDFAIVDPLIRSALLSRLLHRNYTMFAAVARAFSRANSIRIDSTFYDGTVPDSILRDAVAALDTVPFHGKDRDEYRQIQKNVSKGYELKTQFHKFKSILGFWHDLGFLKQVQPDALLPIPDSWDAESDIGLLERFMRAIGTYSQFEAASTSDTIDKVSHEIYTGLDDPDETDFDVILAEALKLHAAIVDPEYGISDLHLLSRLVEYEILKTRGRFVSPSGVIRILGENRVRAATPFNLLPDRWGQPAFFGLRTQ
jgi:hypothetical protein